MTFTATATRDGHAVPILNYKWGGALESLTNRYDEPKLIAKALAATSSASHPNPFGVTLNARFGPVCSASATAFFSSLTADDLNKQGLWCGIVGLRVRELLGRLRADWHPWPPPPGPTRDMTMTPLSGQDVQRVRELARFLTGLADLSEDLASRR